MAELQSTNVVTLISKLGNSIGLLQFDVQGIVPLEAGKLTM